MAMGPLISGNEEVHKQQRQHESNEKKTTVCVFKEDTRDIPNTLTKSSLYSVCVL